MIKWKKLYLEKVVMRISKMNNVKCQMFRDESFKKKKEEKTILKCCLILERNVRNCKKMRFCTQICSKKILNFEFFQNLKI